MLERFTFARLICIAAILMLAIEPRTGRADATSAAPAVHPVDFEREIAPILLRNCAGCHNPSERAGELDLLSAKTAFSAGKSGEPAIKAGDIDQSYIVTRVEAGEMPPKGKGTPLSRENVATLKRWIESGAAWPKDRVLSPLELTTANRAGRDWWSLKSLGDTLPPSVKNEAWVRNPIDAFILSKLEEKQLAPAPPAEKRALLRRVTFDLIGLPPTPEETAAFLADESPQAYERVVDRLLASPHYGERWARSWLDVVRFGESQGFEYDRQRPHAYRYRDWVIAAFNNDLPYDEFVRLQIAGDVLRPKDPEAVIATGYLVAGPWDEAGQKQQGAAMRAVVREDELEDLVGTTTQTFLGLTVNCARCHDHKFDPISQVDYYRVASALSGMRHGERESLAIEGKADAGIRSDALESKASELKQQLAALEEPVRRQILADSSRRPKVEPPRPIAAWDFAHDLRDAIGPLHGETHGAARLADGRLQLDGHDSYVTTAPLSKPLAAKTLEVWVSLDRLDQQGGAAISIQSLDGNVFDAIVFGELEAGRWMAGSNGFVRTKSFNGDLESAPKGRLVQMAIVYGADRTIKAFRNGRSYGTGYTSSSLTTFPAGTSQVVFGLRHNPPGGNKMLAGSIERAQLYDRALTPDEISASAGVPPSISDEEIRAHLNPGDLRERERLVTQLTWIRLQQGLLSGGPVYAVSPSQPEPTHVLARGNPAQKGDLVSPGGIFAASPAGGDLGLAPDAPEADRRAKLARWITAPAAPLAARVMANRLWHYHFGDGIVETPNDFGFNGGQPSHPELLDWLARSLIDGKWSVKQLQRTIVLSATYRQSGRFSQEAAKIDADNRLLWRKSAVRLEAEEIRDAMLVTAGQLNPTMGGPGYQDFKTREFGSTFYDPIDPIGYEFNRRTIYRSWIRSGTNRFLNVFDCPDPSTTTPKRLTTTTPLQALALWNNSFVLRLADNFAERLRREAGADKRSQIELAHSLACNRPPHAGELTSAVAFVRAHGLPAFCRVIFNSNEFLYVD